MRVRVRNATEARSYAGLKLVEIEYPGSPVGAQLVRVPESLSVALLEDLLQDLLDEEEREPVESE